MRTAVCMSGRVSRVEADSPSVIANLIEPYEADVFISVWTPEQSAIDEVVSAYNPISMELEDPDSPQAQRALIGTPNRLITYGGSTGNGNPANVWMMFYRIHKANQLRKAYEARVGWVYDRVIRFRFEVGILNALPIIEPEPATIYIPKGQDHLSGVCDVLAIGDSDSIDKYSSIHSALNHYNESSMPTHPEGVVRKHLELNGVSIERFVAYTTLRGNTFNPIGPSL